jgi:hypothetical protein
MSQLEIDDAKMPQWEFSRFVLGERVCGFNSRTAHSRFLNLWLMTERFQVRESMRKRKLDYLPSIESFVPYSAQSHNRVHFSFYFCLTKARGAGI